MNALLRPDSPTPLLIPGIRTGRPALEFFPATGYLSNLAGNLPGSREFHNAQLFNFSFAQNWKFSVKGSRKAF
jgi:hypothetical protein